MFEKILRFFLENSRLNYTLFFLIVITGMYAYYKTPKEIFPSFELDIVSISGGYSGISIDILDKIVVHEIENEIKSIEGIKEMSSIVTPGSFGITLELEPNINRYETANKVKDAIDSVKSSFPSDMKEPRVIVPEITQRVLNVALGSNELSKSELIEIAKTIETKLLNVVGVSEVEIYGDSDLYYNILLDEQKIEGFGLSKTSVISALSGISYIFPIGKIEDPNYHVYLSTFNGEKTAHLLSQTLLTIDGKKIYLSDIATVEKRREDASSLASFKTKNSITLAIEQLESSDALVVAKNLRKQMEIFQKEHPDILFTIYNDRSLRIQERLNAVESNIMFSMLVIALSLGFLINFRIATVVLIGIPTAFLLGVIYLYLHGFSINMMSLVGVLVAIGIIVDDAIVVSEAIQRRIEEGMDPHEAVIEGSKEMFMPVLMAFLTTLFAFIPALMITGRLGEMIKLVPIVVSALLVASFIETFLFLPIHAKHILSPKAKTLSWEKANNLYKIFLEKLLGFRKIFLILFFLLVPFFTFYIISISKFQLFPSYDASTLDISLKFNVNTKLEDTYDILKKIEKDIWENKEQWSIKTTSSTAGTRKDVAQNRENYPYVGSIGMEFESLEPQNIFDRYITPYLSFHYNDEERIRKESSIKIASSIREFIKKQNYKEKFGISEIFVGEQRMGGSRTDVQIGISSNDNEKTINTIKQLENALKNISGVKTATNNAILGTDEIKIKINPYGEQLGVNEAFIGQALSNLYLGRKVSTALDENNLLEIKVKSLSKENFNSLKKSLIALPTGQSIALEEIVDFYTIRSFERINKDFGERMFYVYANVDTKKITANEVLEILKPLTDSFVQEGIKIKFLGEKQRNNELFRDMTMAVTVALLLITISLLYLFNSFKDTLIVFSVIPLSILGALLGHQIMGINLSMNSLIGALGLAGVVVNDGIVMMTYIKRSNNMKEFLNEASKRLRPIILTSFTTLLGLVSLIFFAVGEAVVFQPLAVSLGFGLLWGTILNLIYVPTLYIILNKKRIFGL